MSEDLTRNLPGDSTEQILILLRSMDVRHTGLEERVDRRLTEGRSTWEQVLGRLDGGLLIWKGPGLARALRAT